MAVLFFDIDGTLVSNKTGKIPQSAIEALMKAKANGHYIFVNTGRTICALRKEVAEIDFDGFLCGCGTYLIYHGEVVLESRLGEQRGKDIIAKMYELGLDGILEGVENNYLPREQSRFQGLENERKYFDTFLPGIGRDKYIEDGGFTYDKLFVYVDEQSDGEAFFEFISEDMDIVNRGQGGYEIIQKGYSKWTACDFIMKKLGIDRAESYAFGDSTNDLAMFEYANHTIAMGDHAKELEPFSEFITKDVDEDGIWNALKKYGVL